MIRGGHCRDCGAPVRARDEFCPSCGIRHPALRNPLQALGMAGGTTNERPPQRRAPVYARRRNGGLIAGLFACVFGILGVFTVAIVFVPLAALCGTLGLLLGLAGRSATGFFVSLLGALLAAVAFVFSPSLWLLAAALVGTSMQGKKSDTSKAGVANQVTAAAATPSAMAVAPLQAVGELRSGKKQTPAAFEGEWARTKVECLDKEGPNSRTLIDLGNVIDGKPAPIFDQYENHCLIERQDLIRDGTALSVTCYEFWEYLEKRTEGRKATIKLSVTSGRSWDRWQNVPTLRGSSSPIERCRSLD